MIEESNKGPDHEESKDNRATSEYHHDYGELLDLIYNKDDITETSYTKIESSGDKDKDGGPFDEMLEHRQ